MIDERWRRPLAFAVVGAINTALHSGAVVALVEPGLTGPVLANAAGFALANTFSYFANARLTFRQRPSWALYRRFATVSMGSLGLTLALSTLAQAMRWHYLWGLLLVLLSGPVLTYLLHLRFTFRRPRAKPPVDHVDRPG
ncbi:MAG: GtrA family protein [Duganella sp.]